MFALVVFLLEHGIQSNKFACRFVFVLCLVRMFTLKIKITIRTMNKQMCSVCVLLVFLICCCPIMIRSDNFVSVIICFVCVCAFVCVFFVAMVIHFIFVVEMEFYYSWYHFLSLYFCIRLWAVPPNSCAWFDIRSARSSNWLSFSPRSIANWCARLISDAAVLARVPKSCKFGPAVYLATERFGLPLPLSPTKHFQLTITKKKKSIEFFNFHWIFNFNNFFLNQYLQSSSRSKFRAPPPNSPLKKLSFGGSGISIGENNSPIISFINWLKNILND